MEDPLEELRQFIMNDEHTETNWNLINIVFYFNNASPSNTEEIVRRLVNLMNEINKI